MFLRFISLLFIILPSVSWADFPVDTLQKQGFESFTKENNGSNFICKNQCFIVISEMGKNDFLKIHGTFRGAGDIGYGFVNGNQIIPGEFQSIKSGEVLDKKFLFSNNQFYIQIPKTIPVILIVNGEIEAEGFSLNMNILNPWEKIQERFYEASIYRPFSPRSINFLEGPTWGGKYINEAFFWWIITLLGCGYFITLIEKKKSHGLKKGIVFSLSVLGLFWLFFDFLHSKNQIKIYNDLQKAGNIMENGRLGKNSDFYEFINFAKTVIPHGEKGNFISPYPFLIEGKYHAYPQIKFDDVDDVKYFIWYNPYGENAPFGYKNPTISSGTLSYGTGSYLLEKEVPWKDYAKIYIIKK